MDVFEGLERDGLSLSLGVIATMYENPFWNERFGERGRRFADEDAGRHIEHLLTALRANSDATFASYGAWLRSVLTTRGMCTKHVVENFDRLADAIAARGWEDGDRAVHCLRAASAQLYEQPLFALRASVVTRATSALYARHPEWLDQWGDEGRRRCADDLEYHLVYAIDAVLNDQPSQFSSYVSFMRGFLARRRLPDAHLDESLQALHDALIEHEIADGVRALIQSSGGSANAMPSNVSS